MAYDQRLADVEREMKGVEQERDDLRAAGDQMQSNLSRILEWARQPWDTQEKMPYEVAMACVEAQSDIDLWTEIRSQFAPVRERRREIGTCSRCDDGRKACVCAASRDSQAPKEGTDA